MFLTYTYKNFNFSFLAIVLILLTVISTAETANAETFTVTRTDDRNGICNSGVDCSLREAITTANVANTDDEIIFEPTVFSTSQLIVLLNGELSIGGGNGAIVITGIGINLLTISGNNTSRVLSVGNGAKVTINNVNITGGNGIGAVSSGRGGGIFNIGNTLTINNSIINDNSTSADGLGGGIFSAARSTLTINNSIVSGNRADIANSFGGGIYSGNATLNIDRSTISNNSSVNGGGIYAVVGVSNITNSTISNNIAKVNGGGINNNGEATMNLINSTVSGNSGPDTGGGISNFGTAFNLTNVTITRNSAGYYGGVGNHSTLNSRNSIIADNIATIGSAPDLGGGSMFTSQGYNLIETIGANMRISGDITGNITGQDPMLDPILRNNGGPTLTHALLSASPAINAGDNTNAPSTDQRGFARISGGIIDIGAFEASAPKARRKIRFF